MPATILVSYPQGVKFDMDYYLKTHMPLVADNWTHYGLVSWRVLSYPDDAPYKVSALLEVSSVEAWEKMSTSAQAETVFGDVPNFSDKQPVVFKGTEEGTS
ncbi:hypothetical protein K431DRAFT_301342 [Polychaeton citri CBS 116435]|uniref:EthD domain-containing protein n=1 Tax=Polychaeton citri CBS 116435 TaxID=1314669 RepID=A0A9P4QDS7_9PEZI|nr:hypothetical protein K431DRAFT_301342 [Polychaeton citri CBS 116435]